MAPTLFHIRLRISLATVSASSASAVARPEFSCLNQAGFAEEKWRGVVAFRYDSLCNPRTENQALKQRVIGQAIRPVNTRRSCFADRVESLNARCAVDIGHNASHRKIGGRADGHQI